MEKTLVVLGELLEELEALGFKGASYGLLVGGIKGKVVAYIDALEPEDMFSLDVKGISDYELVVENSFSDQKSNYNKMNHLEKVVSLVDKANKKLKEISRENEK